MRKLNIQYHHVFKKNCSKLSVLVDNLCWEEKTDHITVLVLDLKFDTDTNLKKSQVKYRYVSVLKF